MFFQTRTLFGEIHNIACEYPDHTIQSYSMFRLRFLNHIYILQRHVRHFYRARVIWFCMIVFSFIVSYLLLWWMLSVFSSIFVSTLTHVLLGARICRGRGSVHLCSDFRSVFGFHSLPASRKSQHSFQRQLPILPYLRYLVFICCQYQDRCLSAQVIAYLDSLI